MSDKLRTKLNPKMGRKSKTTQVGLFVVAILLMGGLATVATIQSNQLHELRQEFTHLQEAQYQSLRVIGGLQSERANATTQITRLESVAERAETIEDQLREELYNAESLAQDLTSQIERLERWQEIDRENSQRNSQSNAAERLVLQTRIVELYRELGRQAEFGEGGIMLPEHLWELWSELHQMTVEEFREAEREFWLYHWLGE